MAAVMLAPQCWQREGLELLAGALGGKDGLTRLVGGAVRDGLAQLPVADVDLATRLLPEDVVQRLKAVGIKTVPTGIAHGTVTAVISSGPVEITTLRRDVATDGRRATIAYSDDWQEDAARRDFTINALYADMTDGSITDFFGGLDDLGAGIVRFIGDPLSRIAEDHLRILRFFRFHARFGKGEPEPSALAACSARANDLMALSRERIADELLKLLALPDPAPSVKLMVECGIFRAVLPEIDAAGVDHLARLVKREADAEISSEPLRRLAACLPADRECVVEVASRLKLSNKARKHLASVAERSSSDRESPFALAYWEGVDEAIARLLIGEGDATKLAGWTSPEFPFSGRHVIKLGVEPGPQVATTLKAVERQWVASGFPEGEAALSLLGTVVAAGAAKES